MSRIPYTNKVGETLSSIADPAAAYSLRALGGGDPMVARVRRSSDDAEKDFTASDMGSGSVANWVNEQLNLTSTLNPTPVGADATWVHTAIDDSNCDLEAINNSATKFLNLKNVVFKGNTKYRFAFDYTVISGTSNLSLKRSTPYQTIAISEGFNSIVLDLTDDSIIQFRCATGATFEASIRNLTVTAIESDGFVTSWYDQSGNDNHATQGTAGSQPKIVDGGVYLGELDFDGVDDFMSMDSLVTLGTEFYVGMVVQAIAGESEANATFLGGDGGGGGNRFFLNTSDSSVAYRNSNSNFTTSLTSSGTDVELISYTAASSHFTTSLNGTEDVDAVISGNMAARYIGGGTVFNMSAHFNELIIYDSNQSANRAAIETNINNHYDIY